MTDTAPLFTVLISLSENTTDGRIADAEIHFTDAAGPLAGLKLIGFSIWQRRDLSVHVAFPSRTYAVNGERRTFALLRPNDRAEAREPLRAAILAAWRAQFPAVDVQ